MAGIQSYRDLVVWRKAMDLAGECYRLAKLMPKSEEYRLVSQLLRAATSVPANIAEGHGRGTRKDYANFIAIARGSLAETETLLTLAHEVGLIGEEESQPALQRATEVGKMLNVLHARLRAPKT